MWLPHTRHSTHRTAAAPPDAKDGESRRDGRRRRGATLRLASGLHTAHRQRGRPLVHTPSQSRVTPTAGARLRVRQGPRRAAANRACPLRSTAHSRRTRTRVTSSPRLPRAPRSARACPVLLDIKCSLPPTAGLVMGLGRRAYRASAARRSVRRRVMYSPYASASGAMVSSGVGSQST